MAHHPPNADSHPLLCQYRPLKQFIFCGLWRRFSKNIIRSSDTLFRVPNPFELILLLLYLTRRAFGYVFENISSNFACSALTPFVISPTYKSSIVGLWSSEWRFKAPDKHFKYYEQISLLCYQVLENMERYLTNMAHSKGTKMGSIFVFR